MRGNIIVIIIILMILSSPVYALNESNSTYINGVIFYNILIASEPVLVGETDYSQAYFWIISRPTVRGEDLVCDVSMEVKINETKVDKIMNFILKNKRVTNDSLTFWFKDQPNYQYSIWTHGIVASYVIPSGKKLTINEFKREKIKFLNETTNRIRELGVLWKLDLEDDYRCIYCDFESGFSYTYIVGISDESDETYMKLMDGSYYGIIRDPQRSITLLFKNDTGSGRIQDVTLIGPSSQPILHWYEFRAYSEYNEDEIRRINRELEAVTESLNAIRNNLSGELNSTEAFSILENISMSNNGTLRQKLDELFEDIKSVDYFIKISKEIENRPHAEWVDTLFGFIINENINKSKQVNDLYEKYNMLENQRRDLFDITVAIYSAALQSESLNKQLNENRISTKEQIKTSWHTAILTIILGSLIIQWIVQWYFQNQQSKKQEKLTQKQIESQEKYMNQLIDEIKKLKSIEENNNK